MRRLLPISLAAVAVLAGSVARAQPDATTTGVGSSATDTVTPPILRRRAEAVYPPEALRDGLSGTVGVEVTVDDTGVVVDARVTSPAGHGFDEAALAAVRKFTFEPARRNGAAMRSNVQLAYEFHPPPPPPAPRADPPTAPPPPPPPPPGGPIQQGPNQTTLVVADRPTVPIGPPPERNAASDSTTSQDELSLRPRFRAEGLLEVVPGLFSVQHAGGGKAQQDFARGFNLDHGTDMAFFIDDVPINAVSHAHGQGYSDLHFIIPETVARVDSQAGTYSATVGDFGTAGATHFVMADHTPESVARVELAPTTGHERLVVVESPSFGDKWRMAVATEVFYENGPFIHPEDYGRLNGYVKATRVLDERSEISFMATAYGGSWNMSGVLPARAVCGEGDGTPRPASYSGSNCISRWDSVDPTQGGASQRYMAWTESRRQMDEHWNVKATVYTLHSNLELFPNDGIAASFQPDGIQYGSQIEQDDSREETGADVRFTHRAELGGMPMRTTFGLQIRNDSVESQLHRTQGRVRLDGIDPVNIPGPMFDGHINELETGIFAEEEVRPSRWLRFVLGVRGDRIDASVNNESPVAVYQLDGYKAGAQLSPKATAVASPLDAWDLFANYGRGFHSNDIRSMFINAPIGALPHAEGPSAAGVLMAPASGFEAGTTIRPIDGLSLSAVAFLIDVSSELVIDGDTASTTPAGPTRRYGGEFTGRYSFVGNDDTRRRYYADVAFTAAHGRFTDAADVAAGSVFLPDAPIRTFSAGVGGRQPVSRSWTIGGDVTVRSMSNRYGDQGGNQSPLASGVPLVETGWTVVNAGLAARWRFLELGADLLNVADVKWREGQFEVQSRLPGEGKNTSCTTPTSPQCIPEPGISFTPGIPRTLMTHAAVYW
jgi:TonB family protein